MFFRALRRFYRPGLAMLCVLVIGTSGFRIIGGDGASLVDAFYMTFITVSTIGFTEVFDMTGRPGARLFTVAVAVSGIGVMTYILSTATAFIVEGEMNTAIRRRKMLNRIAKMKGHFIVCGCGRVGGNVVHELAKTERHFVVIDQSEAQIAALLVHYPQLMHISGDASDDNVLQEAGIAEAAGVFAVTGDDSKNLVITLTARQLRPSCRVVARCHEVNYFSKMQKVGADAIVSPDFTGGMRIVSSMIRPQVVSFLDEMLRTDDNVRVEEVRLPATHPGTAVGILAPHSSEYIVLAIKRGATTVFNPPQDHDLCAEDTLVVMTTPAGRHALERAAAR
ncbi:MAG: potassium channel protein [Betaproteobacteria bacterium]|nr:potassium channel protein [Betaproteobacteria bacterium]